VLSNAERQQRFRDRQSQAGQARDRLTPEQMAECQSIAAAPLYPIPSVGEKRADSWDGRVTNGNDAPVELAETPMPTFLDALALAKEELMAA
jgi:hypothetical protein